MEQTRDKARQHTGQRGRHKGDAHRRAVQHQHNADRAAGTEGAVNGQIGHIQNAVGDVHADGHNAPDKALCTAGMEFIREVRKSIKTSSFSKAQNSGGKRDSLPSSLL